MRAIGSHGRAGGTQSRGQSLVEFALVLPLFIVLMAAIIDFGIGLSQYMTMINAVRAGARLGATNCAIIRKDPRCDEQIQTVVLATGRAGGLNMPAKRDGDAPTVLVTCYAPDADPYAADPEANKVDCNAVEPRGSVKVDASYVYKFVVPMPVLNQLTLHYVIAMMVE